MSRVALIDADTLIFESALGVEYETEWDNDLWTLHSEFQPARAHLESSIDEIREGLQADRIILALSDPERFRTAIMPSYKHNRKKTRKPLVFASLREWCHEAFETFQRPGLEGDDVLGILSTHPTLIPGEKIIVSIDKDMKTIPGLLVNYAHARLSEDWHGEIRMVTEEEADAFHLFQTLAGDATDGYPGCPGVGPVGAQKILGDSPSWAKVVAAYAKKGLGEGVALQNAQVARILRASDYDFKKKEVIRWNP